MRIVKLLAPCLLFTASAQANVWSDLWYRRDQQAQQALRAGDPERAAQLFTDPRAQAYAELEAQHNAAAAQRLAPFGDGASQYNRGNALAKSGDLQGALAAYDDTLKHTDINASLRRDAQHNRDLVARQLQGQKDQQSASPPQHPPSQAKKGDNDTNKDQGHDGDNDKQQSQGGESTDGKDGSKGDSSKPTSAGTPKPAPDKTAPPSTGKPDDSKPTSASTPSAAAPRKDSGERGGQDPNLTEQTAGEPKEAQRAPSARSDAQPPASPTPAGELALPHTEQQIAMEQWLRQIPEDPGGLLRRKFLIEHLMKQQQVQP